jgi:hypothetical protein
MAVCLMLTFTIGSCSREQYLGEFERELGTDNASATLNHIAAYYPGAIALNFPGYIVGIEESPSHWISHSGDLKVYQIQGSGDKVKFLLNKLQREPLQYISQVYRYRGQPFGEGDCALYHLYGRDRGGLMPTCGDPGEFHVEHDRDYRNAFKDSWKALDILRNQLEIDIAAGDYSHLLVVMMGLNTPQEEAIRNFNSLIWAIRSAGASEFRPLLIGITWPSFAKTRWFSPVWESLSYVPKANNADKLGLSWAGALIHEVVKPLSKRITTVVMAHSFGARAMSMAICIGPAIRRDRRTDSLADGMVVDYFLGLEAAFSLNRFRDTVYPLYEDIYYSNACERANKIILTASEHDTATPSAVWADHVGNYGYYHSFCEAEKPFDVACVRVNSAGIVEEPYDHGTHMIYVDTSEVMQFDVPGTSGGGHSDIFRPPTGRLIWNFISEKQ